MRHITTIFFLLILAHPVPAQQWEPYDLPTEIDYARKLCNIENNLFLYFNGDIYRSPDGGDHWQEIYSYTPQNILDQFLLKVNHFNKQLYYAMAADTLGWKLFRSTNLGTTWTYTGSIEGEALTFIADTLISQQSYQGGSYICKKLNSAPWQPIYAFPYDTAGYIRNMVGQGQHLWVLTDKGLYHSPDAGYHWELNLPLSDLPALTGNYKWVYIDAVKDDLMILNEHSGKLYYSHDYGNQWEIIPWSNITLSNSGQHLYCTNPSGSELLRFEGNNASNWVKAPLKANRDMLISGVGEYEDKEWLASQYFGVLRKTPADAEWQVNNGDISLYTTGGLVNFWDHHMLVNAKAPAYSSDHGNTWKNNFFGAPHSSEIWRNGNYSYNLTSNQATILPLPKQSTV